jgi:cytidylate kinase
MIVTIDGPAGAGKSTVARLLAERLGFRFLDTGAMYRAVALAALRRGLAGDDARGWVDLAQRIEIGFEGRRVFLDGEDVSDAIRASHVTAHVRYAADNPRVREHLVELQQAIGRTGNMVTEGRDQGTIVFPHAECKIFLTASPAERARRRVDDLRQRGEAPEFAGVLAEQLARDERDASRPVGPLIKAPDAIEINTDGLSLDDVVSRLAELVNAHTVGKLETQLARRQQAEADQRQINNILPVLVATAGFDGYYREVNAAFERILGWSEQESLSRTFFEFIHPADRAEATAAFDRVRSGEPAFNFLDRNVCKDGSYRWIKWLVVSLPNRDLVFGIGQDVTEMKAADDDRRRAEQALRESERRLSTLLSNLPGVVSRCKADSEWTVEFVSDGVRSLMGCDPATLIGQPGTCFCELIHPDDRPRVFEVMQEALAEKWQYRLEYRFCSPAGKERWLWEQGVGVYSKSGELEAVESFTTDITPLKHAEVEIRQAREELERRVEERTAELAEANRKLQCEQDALRRMLQAGDHDRELITDQIHDGVAQRLLGALMQFEAFRQLDSCTSAEAQAIFAAGLAALRQASAEARGLMNRTRTPVLRRFGLKAAIADLIDQFSEQPSAPEIMYRCDVQFRRLASVLENTIFRVAQESLVNACLHSRAERVRVILVQNGDKVTLEVEDNGIGFDVTHIAKGRFGLDGIRERARLLGTGLIVESEPGKGTRIRATFPVISAHEQEQGDE